MTQGKAFLVGAGPGRADWITVRGLEVLRQAEILIYDRLIAPELLKAAPICAERIYVGKESGHHQLPQEQITSLLVESVRQGKQVVRLKGGDPFVFGRGGEEALALAQAGLPFEIVPGVSSAIAVPGSAGIPVTHRGLSTAFAVVTGHETPDKAGLDTHSTGSSTDWNALARIPTLVILMGLENAPAICRALIMAGRAGDTPAAAIQQGATPHQKVVIATLQTLAQAIAEHCLTPPVTIVIGRVVRLADALGTQ